MDQTMVSINIMDQTMESINIIKLFNWEKFLKIIQRGGSSTVEFAYNL